MLAVISVLVFIPVAGLQAQLFTGFSAGYQHSDFHDRADVHYSATYDSDPGYRIALTFREKWGRMFSLGFMLEYSYRAFSIEAVYGGLGSYSRLDAQVQMGSLSFSILPEFTVGDKPRFYINAGLGYGGIIHSYMKGTGGSWSMGVGKTYDLDGTAKGYFGGEEVTLQSGMGVELPVSKRFAVTAEGRFSMGLSDISQGGFGSYAEFLHSLNYSVSAGLVYKIGDTGVIRPAFSH